MDFLRTALHYASVAWRFITGIPSDVGQAFDHVWRFVGSLYSLLSHLWGRVSKDVLQGYLQLLGDLIDTVDGMSRTMDRIKTWIWRYQVLPVRNFLLLVIVRMGLALQRKIAAARALSWHLYYLGLAYTRRQVTVERAARIADVKAARAYAARLVSALRSALEREAADAYNANTPRRVTVITKVIDEIANRNPLVRALTGDFITALLDLLGSDDPALRLLLRLLLPKIIDGLGVDKPLGDLLTALLGPLAGTPQAHSIGDAIGDLAARTSALEDQWARFMTDGGPEVEQAGREWKEVTSVGVNVSLLAFFGLAVADPSAWATGVSDTMGALVNDTVPAIAALIRNA